MPPRRSSPALLAALCVALGTSLLLLAETRRANAPATGPAAVLDGTWQAITERGRRAPAPDSVLHGAVMGMLRSAGDPYGALLAPVELADVRRATGTPFGGIGVELEVVGDTIAIANLTSGGPAAQAGIRLGDRLLAIDTTHAIGMTADAVAARLRGDAGTRVRLDLFRPGTAARYDTTVTRARIRQASISVATKLRASVGLIVLDRFTTTTTQELTTALDSLLAEGVTSLLIDLRRNPGGVLHEATGTADLFLPAGLRLAETRGRSAEDSVIFVDQAPARYPSLPVALLTGPATASAAEIFAGALQDHHRALVIGGRTHGKGSVQGFFRVADGYTLKLTTATWHTPSGRSIDRILARHPGDPGARGGIEPDHPVAGVDSALAALLPRLGPHVAALRTAVRRVSLLTAGGAADREPLATQVTAVLAAVPALSQTLAGDPTAQVRLRAHIAERLAIEAARLEAGDPGAARRSAATDPVVRAALAHLAHRAPRTP